MTDFLDKLKKAVDEEDFNSEAAKKIIDINELADQKTVTGSSEELDKRLEAAGVRNVSAEEAVALNSQYEEKMELIKKRDAVNVQLATLIEIEDMVVASVDDMFSFIDELEVKFEKEFEAENPIFDDLSQKIKRVKSKYDSIKNA